MKTKHSRLNQHPSLPKRGASIFSVLVLLASTFAADIGAQNMKSPAKAGRLSEDQRILHVLNRLGFGARPGDVERVKAMGVDKYIEQQLSPEKIDDSAAEARLQNLETLRMTTAELYRSEERRVG